MPAIPSIDNMTTIPTPGSATFEEDAGNLLNQIKNDLIPQVNAAIAAINSNGSAATFTKSFIDNTDSPYTASNAEEVWADTTSGTITITLPASPSQGQQVRVVDWKGTFNSNNVTIDRNGSNIEGGASNYTLSLNNEEATLTYTGASYGWAVKERA